MAKAKMKWFKRIVLAGVLLPSFVVIALVGIVVLVDPNDYRDEIAVFVKEKTGQDLIMGDIGLSVFPWLGLELEDLRLKNSHGFSDEVFAGIDTLNIKVALLPLFKLETRIGTLQFDGLTLNLERLADGRTNWEDIIATPDEAQPEAEEPELEPNTADERELPQFYVGSIDIRNTNISWRDATDKSYIRIENLRFNTDTIRLNKAIGFELVFGVRNDSPKLIAGLDLKGYLLADWINQQYALEKLHSVLQASGILIPGGAQTVLTRVERIGVDVPAQRIRVQQLTTEVAQLKTVLNLEVESYAEQPRVRGQFSANVAQLRELMRALGTQPPETADPAVLGALQAELTFKATENDLNIEPINIGFDDSRISGSLGISDLENPQYQFQFNIDRFNADRYLPPAPAKTQTQTVATLPEDDDPVIVLPLEQLRILRAQGALTLGELQLLGLKFANFQATVNAADGHIQLQPLQLDLYSGRYAGGLTIDATADVPAYSIASKLSEVQVEPLLFDYMQSKFISGQMNADINVTTRGQRVSEFKKNLNGSAAFNFRDGALSMDLREKIREAKAKLKKEPYVPPSPQPTRFSAVKASTVIDDGVVHNKDLEIRARHLYISGQGQYALPTDTIDYVVTLLFSEDPAGQDDPLKEFHDLPIKLTLKGKLEDLDYLSIGRDALQSAVGAKVKRVVEEKKDAARQELKKEVKQKKQEKVDELKDQLKDKLKLR